LEIRFRKTNGSFLVVKTVKAGPTLGVHSPV